MTNIHLIGGEKGGVGKSLVARLLAQYFIDRQRPFIGFDSDRSHGALLRFYAEFASPVVIDRHESLDSLIEAADAQRERRVLVDLAAQTQTALGRWIDEADLLELAGELQLGICYWHVMDSGRDSVDLLRSLLDRFADRLDYVLVLNQVRGDDFGILEQSGQKRRALDLGARIINLKRLHDAAMLKIDAASNSFWAATQGDADNGLGIMDRQRVKLWMKHAFREFDGLDV